MVEYQKRVRRLRFLSAAVLGIHIFGLGIGLYGLKFKNGFKVAKKPETIINKKIYALTKDKHIANTIANSKYPKILTAIAKVESDFRPQIKGDSGKSYGLYQIQQHHWGRVGESVEEQTQAAERIVSFLIKKHGLLKGIERYNGTGRQAREYRKKVLTIVAQL